jgi:hypothetical protein
MKNFPARTRRRAIPFALAAVALVVWGCSHPRERPAQAAIAQIDAELTAAGTAPAKYIPGELENATSRLEVLKQKFGEADYDAVLDAAPDVLAEVRALTPAAAARAAELDAALETEWSGLVEAVPPELDAMRTAVGKAAGAPRLPAGLTAESLELAKKHAADAQTLWDRALLEQAAGRMPEAVTLAHQVRDLVQRVHAVPGVGAVRPVVE